MEEHWVYDYLGKPWKAGARGPDCYDCFGLLYDVYRKLLAIEIAPGTAEPLCPSSALAAIKASAGSEEWQRLKEPKEFCAVAMGRRGAVFHVGIWTDADGGNVVHSLEYSGVRVDSVRRLISLGFSQLRFYSHAVRS